MIKRTVHLMVLFLIAMPLMADDSVSLKYTYKPDLVSVPLLKDIQGKSYLPLVDVAKFYGVEVKFDSQTRRVALSKGKNQVKLVLSQPVFLTTDPVESFPIKPVEVVSGQLSLLPETAEDLFTVLLNVNVQFNPDQQTLVAGGIQPKELREEKLADSQSGKTLPAHPAPHAAASSLSGVPAAAPTLVPTPTKVEEVETKPAPEERPRLGKVEEEMPSSKQVYLVRRIVIDPGHGGKDVGAKGYDKRYCEKQATLDIGKKVAELLKQEGDIEVLMTRDTDKYISLKYRTEFANRHNADLFVSIHCNSNPRSLATGTETYVYSARPSNKLAAVAAVSENGINNELANIFADLHNKGYGRNSYELAKRVEERIRDRLKQHLRHIQHAPFYVLRQVDMPAILIETAFISNKSEEIKLMDPYWREKIAKAIADGIVDYKRSLEGTGEDQHASR